MQTVSMDPVEVSSIDRNVKSDLSSDNFPFSKFGEIFDVAKNAKINRIIN